MSGEILSQGEWALYKELLKALSRGLVGCPKVRLADLVSVLPNAWDKFGKPVSGKRVDFVLADSSSMAEKLVIELDDKSNERVDRKERDDFDDAVIDSAGISILHVKAASTYLA